MSGLTTDAVRSAFLRFFTSRDHQIIPSHSLIPPKGSPLLFTSAGVDQFLSYMLGHTAPPSRRLASVQKVFRTTDLDEVGDFTHHTFFEMLGNWSIGDYFKDDAIAMAWELSTGLFGIDPTRIAVTVHPNDDVSPGAWRRVGVPQERIFTLSGNWWPEALAVGPCGPDSELFYDWGPEHGCGRPTCGPDCSCGRYVEYWNLVFMQYDRDAEGKLTPLPTANVDTGMGVERMACIQQGVRVTYDTDVLQRILRQIAATARQTYGASAQADRSMRIIADHSRAATFLLADGVRPGNDGRGYVLRRVIRRAVRQGVLLDISDNFLADISASVVHAYGSAYPELHQYSAFIQRYIADEEQRFRTTLNTGIVAFERIVHDLERHGRTVVPGEQAFALYDAHGLPLEVVEELASERHLTVDVSAFQQEMARQVAAGKESRRRTHSGAVGEAANEALAELTPTPFVGYETITSPAEIVRLFAGGAPVEVATPNDTVAVVLSQTPFYTESGGQVADAGVLRLNGTDLPVTQVEKLPNGAVLHHITVQGTSLQVGDVVEAMVDAERRQATRRNHTATHLLHRALRGRLGDHVEQRGSVVSPDHLTFDFSHGARLTPQDLEYIEQEVNQQIRANREVVTVLKPLAEAKAEGAMALFDEKYGDTVRVVSIDSYSKELCGGTHVARTGDIGAFFLVAETGIGSGVRRVEAVTGSTAVAHYQQLNATLSAMARQLQTSSTNASQRLETLLAETNDLKRSLAAAEADLLRAQAARLATQAVAVDGYAVLVGKASVGTVDALRTLGDLLLDQLGSAYIVLAAPQAERALLLTAVSPALKGRGNDASSLVKELTARLGAGGGGGNPRMATGSSPALSSLEGALKEIQASLLSGKNDIRR